MGIILFILVGQNVVSIYCWKQHESIINLLPLFFSFPFQYIYVLFMEIQVHKNHCHCVRKIEDFVYFLSFSQVMAEKF